MNSNVVQLERVYNAPVNVLWKALTDKTEMKKWYFDLEEFKAEVGFKFIFMGGPCAEKQYVHLCEVTEVIPMKKLTYSWSYQGFEGMSYVTFELFDQEESTRLVLTHTGIETFPQMNGDFTISSFKEGWGHFINLSLKAYLEIA